MENQPPRFEQLVEAYVFKVAAHWIESDDPETQSQLINLCSQVCESTSDGANRSRLPATSPTEWKPLLEKPVDWGSVHRSWLVRLVDDRIKRHERYVAHLERAVEMSQHGLQQMQDSGLREPGRSQLIAYYTRTLSTYRQQLVAARQWRHAAR